MFLVEAGSTLTLTDCKGNTGKVKHTSDGSGSGVKVENGGTFNMYGGTITKNTATTGDLATQKGGGVYVNGGTFTMKDGTISGNNATNSTDGGVGVYNSSTFTMDGGTITGNTADQGNGGGVYVKSGTFEMNYSASVKGNTATNTIKENTTYGGVGVYGGTFTMNGNASIESNRATNGGGVYVNTGSQFNMNGSAKVTNNTDAGVYVRGGTFTVSDKPTVTENTNASGAASNVYLTGSEITITIGGTLNEGANIGVTKNSALLVATGNRELTPEDAKKFKSNRAGYEVSVDPKDNKQLVLTRTAVKHDHSWSYQKDGDDTIKAVCTGTPGSCDYQTTPATVTISMTQSTYPYSENMDAPTATLTHSANWPEDLAKAQESQIRYYKYANDGSDSAMYGAPKDAGKYKASITVGDQTAFVKYEITKKPQNTLYVRSDKETLAVGDMLTLSFSGGSGTGEVVYNALGSNGGVARINGKVLIADHAGIVTVTAVKKGDTEYAEAKSEPLTITITEKTGGTTPSQPGGSSSGGSGSYDSNPIIKTETKNNPDGSTTKTETRKDGTVTATTTGKDGSTGTVKTDKNGKTEMNAKLSDKAVEDAKKSGEPVKVPVEVEASRNSGTAPTVKVELPKNSGKTEVEIPVSNAKPGTVAVLVHADGTEEILKASVPTENGIRLTVDGSATVKIIDNSKDFVDTRNHWAREEIDFVSARELVNGMSATRYAPDATATRAQLWTILARQNDANLSGGNTWYEKAQLWSKDKGISDGTNPGAAINRAQMVTMLWRTMGQPAATDKVSFADVPADSYYAQAVAWALESGITQGVGGDRFDPNATCTRAQIAAFLARSMK